MSKQVDGRRKQAKYIILLSQRKVNLSRNFGRLFFVIA